MQVVVGDALVLSWESPPSSKTLVLVAFPVSPTGGVSLVHEIGVKLNADHVSVRLVDLLRVSTDEPVRTGPVAWEEVLVTVSGNLDEDPGNATTREVP